MKLVVAISAAILATSLISPNAWADSANVLLDETNCSGVGCTSVVGTGPFGVVNLNLSGGNILFDIKLYQPFWNTAVLGIFHGFGFNWGGAGAAPNINITSLPSGWSSSNPQSPGNTGGYGPFGKYVYNVDGPGGSGQTPDAPADCSSTGLCEALSFTVAKTSGSFSSVFDLIKKNSYGYSFATDIRNSGSTANTYKLGSGGPLSPVPEPKFVTLLVLGMVGLFALARRRRAVVS